MVIHGRGFSASVEGKTSEKHACVSGLQHRPSPIAVWWLFSHEGLKASNQCNWNCFISLAGGAVILARKHFNPNFDDQSWLKTRIHCFDIYFCS